MKKIFILTSLVIICITSMSFRGCSIGFFDVITFAINSTSGTQFDYFDNSAIIFYNLSVGDNGLILRSQGTNNFVFNQIPSGTTQNLNFVRPPNNPYQDEVAIAGNSGTVLVSGNSGLNWTVKTPVTSENLYGVDHSYFLYAVGDNGTILYANEIMTGNLVSRPSGTSRNLRSVTISIGTNPQRIVAVGEKGTIVRSTNGGFDWDNVSIPDTTFDFYALSKKSIYYPADIFIAVGSGGRIYKSTDVGATWQQKTSGTTSDLRSVYFLSPDSGIVAGDNGTIRLTTDGGNSWFTNSYFNSPTTRHYRSVSMIYRHNKTFSALSDTMFFVSEDPVTVGIEPVNAEIPNSFSLFQNYPNPFNPATKLKFQIPNNKFVKLTIFDMLGKEIETLVNEELHAGTYEYEWNGINLPSGVYFYKLTSGSYSGVKKMILLK